MSEEKLELAKPLLIWGNLTLIAWVFLAFTGAWFYNQIGGWLLLIFDSAMIWLILRRLGCSSCYNCKSCTSGFGRIAGAFFGYGSIKKGSVGNRLGLIAFIYFLLAPLPIALLLVSLLETFSAIKIIVLLLLLALTVYSGSSWLKKK